MLISLLFGLVFAADTISGTWTGEWGPNTFERSRVVAELKHDGKVVTGTFNSGYAATIWKGTLNEKTGALHLEAAKTCEATPHLIKLKPGVEIPESFCVASEEEFAKRIREPAAR